MNERPELTTDQVEDLEALLRVARRRTPLIAIGAVFTIIAVAAASFAIALTRDADQQIHALSAEAAANQAQAKAFEGFLQRFIAEENYVCSVEAAEAVRDGLPTPAPNVCAVAVPTTRPQPPATPQPAVTAAPVAPRPTAAATASARPVPMPSATATAALPVTSVPTPRPRCLLAILCLLPSTCVHSHRRPLCG